MGHHSSGPWTLQFAYHCLRWRTRSHGGSGAGPCHSSNCGTHTAAAAISYANPVTACHSDTIVARDSYGHPYADSYVNYCSRAHCGSHIYGNAVPVRYAVGRGDCDSYVRPYSGAYNSAHLHIDAGCSEYISSHPHYVSYAQPYSRAHARTYLHVDS